MKRVHFSIGLAKLRLESHPALHREMLKLFESRLDREYPEAFLRQILHLSSYSLFEEKVSVIRRHPEFVLQRLVAFIIDGRSGVAKDLWYAALECHGRKSSDVKENEPLIVIHPLRQAVEMIFNIRKCYDSDFLRPLTLIETGPDFLEGDVLTYCFTGNQYRFTSVDFLVEGWGVHANSNQAE